MQEKCREEPESLSQFGPPNIWGPVGPNSLDAPNSGSDASVLILAFILSTA